MTAGRRAARGFRREQSMNPGHRVAARGRIVLVECVGRRFGRRSGSERTEM